MAKQEKQKEVFNQWVEEKLKTTFVRVDDEYKDCRYQYSGWIK
jgi:peptidyl-prolyl cis-trans isomerase SurA